MNDQATLQSIAREEFAPDLPRGGAHTCGKSFQACFYARLWYNHMRHRSHVLDLGQCREASSLPLSLQLLQGWRCR
jgi:hypothetical protein